MLTWILKDIRIVDGTGKGMFQTDIGIRDGRIERIGTIDCECAPSIINGAGLIACPGFIDMHSHMDIALLKTPSPDAKIRQGVTTDLIGQDGLGTIPVSQKNKKQLALLLAGLNGVLPEEEWIWGGFNEYAGALEQRGLPSNVAILASHGPLRVEAMGMENRPPTLLEMDAMCSCLAEMLEDGAFGLSTGLIYPPCSFGDAEELTVLNRKVAENGGVFVVHMRDEGYHLLRSIDEVANACMLSGAKLHISHFEAFGKVNWRLIDGAISKLEEYGKQGVSVSWDRYPYLAGCTVLSAVLPPWVFEGGPDKLIENLLIPSFRSRIHADFEKGLDVWNNRQISVGWDNVIVTSVQKEENQWMHGLSCSEISQKQNKNVVDSICDLLAEERLATMMVTFYGSEEVLEKILSHRWGTVGSDGIYGALPHPRLYGAFPKFLRDFSLDTRRLTLEEAVRKITSGPAEILGIQDRGRIEEGCWADIVLFDPVTLRDKGTYQDPVQFPEGIHSVFVNGVLVVEEGKPTGALPGRVLRKG